MLRMVFFDLDGTLLPMDQEEFIQTYFPHLCKKVAPLGIDSKKLVSAIWEFLGSVSQNDGSRTNEALFWEIMTARFGGGIREKTEAVFDDFYQNEFNLAKTVCGYHPMAKTVIDFLHSRGIIPLLATNPVFPGTATHARIRWAGLQPEDFCHITVMENSAFAKPNPAYYKALLQLVGVKAEECLMVGNDVQEDGAATALGMPVFFLTDCLIDRRQTDLSPYPHGNFTDLLEFLKKAFAAQTGT